MSRCEQIRPYLPGFAGGDLRADTTRIVGDHVHSCAACRAEAAVHDRVVGSLATLAGREVEPPAYMLDAILESVNERRSHRLIPLVPVGPVNDAAVAIARVVSEHREQIASTAGTALVAAGAAYALWRAVRGRPRHQPATP